MAEDAVGVGATQEVGVEVLPSKELRTDVVVSKDGRISVAEVVEVVVVAALDGKTTISHNGIASLQWW